MNNKHTNYIKNKKYKIYKKSLGYKGGEASITYYFVIEGKYIIDLLLENEITDVDESRLSNDNVNLFVYKCVEEKEGSYYSFRSKGRIHYELNKEVVNNNDIGPGLFFCKSIEEAKRDSFTDQNNRVILECKVNINDLNGARKSSSDSLEFSKCIPIGIVEGDNY